MIFGRTKPISARKTKNISFLRGANYERVMANIALINRYGTSAASTAPAAASS